MLEFIGIVLTLIVFVIIACAIYIIHLGKAKPVFDVEHRSAFERVELTDRLLTVACEVPYRNEGKMLCTIMDCYPRVLLPQEQFSGVKITGRIEREGARRNDGYFESVLVYPQTGDTLIVTLEIEAQSREVHKTFLAMPDVNIDIVYQIVDRHRLYIDKVRLVLTSREVREAVEMGGAMDNG